MKRKPKKLVLAKETIRNLEVGDLRKAAGGESENISECGGIFTCAPEGICYNHFLTERSC